jgi:hypothetical protein
MLSKIIAADAFRYSLPPLFVILVSLSGRAMSRQPG